MNKRKTMLLLAMSCLFAYFYILYDKNTPDPTRKLMEKISMDVIVNNNEQT